MKLSLLHNNRGVTLVELMIVISILGVIAGIAGPNFSTFIAERSVAAETRRVIGVLKLARSEARARGATVTVSRPTSGDWSDQLNIYMDATSANHPFDVSVDDLVKEQSTSNRSIQAVDDQNGNDEWISFNMRGWLAENGPVLIAVCSPSLATSSGMYIEINRVGRIRESSIGTDNRGCNP